ncbi:hypothetical protein JQ580_31370 [Bradyrhizobium japonicum]|uniref:hypothetical protein n=1 Tax=Bradyrhizobium japonicum TaxID=375 RepID=UPI001BAA248A|nr:hypothetical protein [Bradyrhizobium japonicum]MBR0995221.1 hypothetical protein [Bradyrhizobium japonicum]
MSRAMQQIVDGFVKVNDRRALIDLLAHRRKILGELQEVTGINPTNAIQTIRDELAIIELGFDKLRPPPGSLPENEWGQ